MHHQDPVCSANLPRHPPNSHAGCRYQPGDTGDFSLNQYYLVKIAEVNLGDAGDFSLNQDYLVKIVEVNQVDTVDFVSNQFNSR